LRTLIDIDENILKEAMKIARTPTKKETVRIALEELIKAGLRRNLKEMAGSGAIEMDLHDLKKLRRKRNILHDSLTLKTNAKFSPR
jgi:Arc/MetJ family transcription regulator